MTECQERCSSVEFSEWLEEYHREPWGEYRDDLRSAHQTMHTLAGAGTGTTLYRDTYMLRFDAKAMHADDATEQSVREAAQFQRTRRGRWLGVYA